MPQFFWCLEKIIQALIVIIAIPLIILGALLSLLYRLKASRGSNPVTILRNRIQILWDKKGYNALKKAMRIFPRPCVRCPSCKGKNKDDCVLCGGHGSIFKKDFL